MKTAYFAGGCFWCIASVFETTPGVLDVTSGYSGGDETAPSYLDVKAQKTGHRETIRIDYDETVVGYADLLRVFLDNVDPADPDGQYVDRGRSYTLAVYYETPEERETAEAALEALRLATGGPVYIALERFRSFYRAEEYHQHYALRHPAEFAEEMAKSGRQKSQTPT